VLVVDDEPLIRWWLVESLGERGYDVTEAGDGCSAIRAISDSGDHFDTVLLDFRMPDSNDLTLLKRLRSLAPQARFILMTAYGSPEVRQGALALGAYRVVDKPFKVDDLTALVPWNRAPAPAG
jgi:DNA-binding NtrC family response regulator